MAASAIVCGLPQGCGHSEQPAAPDGEILVQVGDSVLTLADVERRIPHGLDEADSVMMFNNIVDSWVSSLVLKDMAEKNITNLERIERMTEAYRTSLIIDEYLKSMAEQSGVKVPEERIKEYYDTHPEEFILTQPLVKGAYIRVDEHDSKLPELRKWMAQFTEESIDRIEGAGLHQATAYEYFRDEWHEWSELADRIPSRITDADAFVKANSDFETAASGSVHLLHISDRLLSGDKMPYDYAKARISEILRATEISGMRRKLKDDIYRRMIAKGWLKAGAYDPLTGKMKHKNTK